MKKFKDYLNENIGNDFKLMNGFIDLISFLEKANKHLEFWKVKVTLTDLYKSTQNLSKMSDGEIKELYTSYLENNKLTKNVENASNFVLINYFYRGAGDIEQNILGDYI